MNPEQIVMLHVMERIPLDPQEFARGPIQAAPDAPHLTKVVASYAFETREKAVTYVINQVREHGTQGRHYALQTANELQQSIRVNETFPL